MIPAQKQGAAYDTLSEMSFSTEKQAKTRYQLAKQRLLSVNHWHETAAEGNVVFSLFDSQGEKANRLPVIGDYIRIEMPGPLNQAGDGFDWLKLEEMSEDERVHVAFVLLCLSPSANPKKQQSGTAHFLNDSASITFLLKELG